MTDWLTAHPDIHHIGVGTVNTETGQGVFSAVQTANRDKDVLLVTNNNGMQTLAAFEQGENCWLGGTAYFPDKVRRIYYPDVLGYPCKETCSQSRDDGASIPDKSKLGCRSKRKTELNKNA